MGYRLWGNMLFEGSPYSRDYYWDSLDTYIYIHGKDEGVRIWM